jgi:hypothetical protein
LTSVRSLSAASFRSWIINAIHASADPDLIRSAKSLGPNFVYENPTIYRLAVLLLSLKRKEQGDDQHQAEQKDGMLEHYNSLLLKYCKDIGQCAPQIPPAGDPPPDGPIILITRTTGNIGSHILAQLLSEQHISTIYALNRALTSKGAVDRLHLAFVERHLSEGLLSQPQLHLLVGNVTKPNFGLELAEYKEVRLLAL